MHWSNLIMVLVLALVVSGVVAAVRMALGHGRALEFPLTDSRDDLLRQTLVLMACAFGGYTLLAIDRDLHDLISAQTVGLLTTIGTFVAAYRLRARIVLLAAIIGAFVWWGSVSTTWIERSPAPMIGAALLGLLLIALAPLHERAPRFTLFAGVYALAGTIATYAMVTFLSTQSALITLAGTGARPITVGALAVMLFALGGALVLGARNGALQPFERYALAAIALLFCVAPFIVGADALPFYGTAPAQLSARHTLAAIVFNLAAFAFPVGVVLSGLSRRDVTLINIGALLSFILIVVKYFDWFFTFMDKSVFFLSAGTLLFAVGWFLERGRRRLIAASEAT